MNSTQCVVGVHLPTCWLKGPGMQLHSQTIMNCNWNEWCIIVFQPGFRSLKVPYREKELKYSRWLAGRQDIHLRTFATLGSNVEATCVVANGLKLEKPQLWSFKVECDHVHQTLVGTALWCGTDSSNSLGCLKVVCVGASHLPGRQREAHSSSGCCGGPLMECVSPVRICCCLQRLGASQ